MLARYHGINLIKDRYFLYSGLLLFLSSSAVLALMFVRGEARPPGAHVKAGDAPIKAPEGKAKTAATQARPLEADAQAAPAKAEPVTQVQRAQGKVEVPRKTQAPETKVKPFEVPGAPGQRLTTRRSFFEKKFGTLAVLPRATIREAANRAGTFLVLQEYTVHPLNAAHSPVWFQFNHYLPESDGQPRHLGALIIVLSRSAGCKHVEVYRNSGWTRPNSNEILGEFSESPSLSWEQFVAVNRASTSDPHKLDDAYGGPWHGFPRGGRKYSWDYQVFWNWAVSEYEKTSKAVMGDFPLIDCYRVSARLLAYTPTPIPESKRPLVFYVHAAKGDSLFVALYSLFNSGQDTRTWYWIQLK